MIPNNKNKNKTNNIMFFNYYGTDVNTDTYVPGRFIMSVKSPSDQFRSSLSSNNSKSI